MNDFDEQGPQGTPAITGAPPMASRFRGFLPVVVDVETGGFESARHALLEIAAVPIEMDDEGFLFPGETVSVHVEPAPGLDIDPKSLAITGIQLDHPFRDAQPDFGKLKAQVIGEPPLFDIIFTDQPVKDYRDTLKADTALLKRFNQALRARGIMKGESKYYVSVAHTQADIDHTIGAWEEALVELKSAR